MKKLLALFSILTCATVFAADYYVDSTADATTATGSSTSPFTTIKAAVDAANAQYTLDGIPSTINVKGGESCTYTIATADDLISVTASNLTIQAWAGTGTPKVVLDSELSVATNNPSIITVKSSALDCTIKGFDFYYYINNNKTHSGNSLGEHGRIIDVYAGRCTVDSCKFYQNMVSTTSWGAHTDGIITSRGEEGSNRVVGYELVVKNCYFSKVGRNNGRTIRSGTYAQMISNIFDDCAGYFYPIKQSIAGNFISNRIVNARASIYSNGGNYGEYNEMEIAYNIFVSTSDQPFFKKAGAGMNSLKCHHNTIVGGSALMTTYGNSKFQWKPKFYNNLIVLTDPKTIIISEEAAHVGDTNPTTFNKSSSFRDNVWLATDFNGGSAPLNLSQYKLVADSADSVGLYLENNLQLSLAPVFIETEDVFSEDFYRLNSTRYPWAEGLNSSYDTTPVYIGAMEPVAIAGEPGEFFNIDSFTVTSESYAPLVEQTFSVVYSQNVGDVIVYFDFEGDGVYDYEGNDLSVTHTYPVAGDYYPSVKIIDSATGKELSSELTVPLLKIRRMVSYVDSLATEGGDGSEANPYKTIKKAILTADNNASIFVRGGEGRIYEINSADDLISISQYRLTILGIGYENPYIVVSHELSNEISNPNVITIEEEAFEVTISNLDFVWYGEKNEDHPGNSLGNEGRIINVNGDYTTIKNCSFRLEGAYNKILKSFAIRANATQGGTQPGAYMRIEGCSFEGHTGENKYMNGIYAGNFPVIIQNTFTNCNYMFTCLKEGRDFTTFTSNSLYECHPIYTDNKVFGNSAEMPSIDISYNKFITSTGEPFIVKANHGLHDKNCTVHHNTVIGASAFLKVEVTNKDRTLKPQIYDNLILLAPDGVVIEDNTTAFGSSMTSAFKDETTFNNNVYMASTFTDGTAQNLSNYKLNVTPADCLEIDNAPRFMSTEMGNADEYRIRATKLDWAFTSSVGGYPNYVGAVEPFLAPLSTTIIIK